MRLQVPLFPPQPAFAAINTRLTSEARAVTGGDASAPIGAAAFRATPLSEGDYIVPLQTNSDGSWFLDLSAIEQAYLQQQGALTGLRRLLQGMRANPRPRRTTNSPRYGAQ